MELKAEDVKNIRSLAVCKEFLRQAIEQIDQLNEELRWRKFPDEKPSEEMEGMDFIVSNGFFHREICEWRGYWNNDPFCGDRFCEDVKFWCPLPKEPEHDK